MRNGLIAFVILLFAVVVTGTRQGAATSTPRTDGQNTILGDFTGANGVYCSMIADAPHRDASGDKMVATARYRCDKPGAQIGMIVSLQKQDANGQWATVTSQQFNANGADTTRDRDEVQRTRTVTAACADGTYRTTATGGSASQNKDGKNVQKSLSDETRGTKNPCSRRR